MTLRRKKKRLKGYSEKKTKNSIKFTRGLFKLVMLLFLVLKFKRVFPITRIKQAIAKKEEVVSQLKQQYEAACKRADHLEGLLEQQRKLMVGKK